MIYVLMDSAPWPFYRGQYGELLWRYLAGGQREAAVEQARTGWCGAIKNKRFVVLPLSTAAEGVRAPIALKTLAAGLYPDKEK